MLSVCFLLWCLGPQTAPAEQVTFTNDFRHAGRNERIVGYERRFLAFGAVEQTTAENGVFVGALPVNVRLLPRVSLAGGGIIASTTVPQAGTRLNFMARLQFDVTDRLALTYWHWSNAHLGNRNPSVDSIGLTVRLRSR